MAVKPCGTQAAYYRHLRRGEPPCDEDRRAAADYEANRRRRQGRPSRATWRPPPCGTAAAYQRHRRMGERPCLACVEAWNADQRRRRARHAEGRITISSVILDVLETNGISMGLLSLYAWVNETHPEWTETTVRRTLTRMVADGRVERVEFGDEIRYRT